MTDIKITRPDGQVIVITIMPPDDDHSFGYEARMGGDLLVGGDTFDSAQDAFADAFAELVALGYIYDVH